MSEQIVIISPHCDDELIGCYSVLNDNKDKTKNVVYTTNQPNERREESLKLKEKFNLRQFFVNYDIPPVLMDKSNIYYFPDPINEMHPDHRKSGVIGEQMVRNGFNVIFYTIQKNTPYIYTLNDEEINDKENYLNEIYPSQKSLWEYEKKYILFEGYCKWLIP